MNSVTNIQKLDFLNIYICGGGLFLMRQDALKEFIFDCKLRKLSERTIISYRNNNLALFRFIESEYDVFELEETNHVLIKGYIEFLTNKKLSEAYINTIVRTFRAYFKYSVDERYILHNPIDKVKRQKEPITLINTFIDDEVKKSVMCLLLQS